MMALRNCPMPWHNVSELNMEIVNKMKESKSPERDIIIDYNDWIDTRNVPVDKLKLVEIF